MMKVMVITETTQNVVTENTFVALLVVPRGKLRSSGCWEVPTFPLQSPYEEVTAIQQEKKHIRRPIRPPQNPIQLLIQYKHDVTRLAVNERATSVRN